MLARNYRLSCMICVATLCFVLVPGGPVHAASVHGGVYGWGRPTGSISYIDKSLNGQELSGVIGQYGELLYDADSPGVGYTLQAQSVLNTDTMQGYMAIDNHTAGTTIQGMDGWINCFAGDTYTVTGGTAGDVVEAIFTCAVSGTLSIEPVLGTSPHSHGYVSFRMRMHGTYGDPATIPNWINAGMSITYANGGIEFQYNDLSYYDDYDDDQYDLDRHTPILSSMVEGQDYTVDGNTILVHATFQIPVTMISGHDLPVECELDISGSTADSYWYPDRTVDIVADFWNTGVSSITLAEPYQDNYTIVRESGVPEPASLSLLALGGLAMIRRRRAA